MTRTRSSVRSSLRLLAAGDDPAIRTNSCAQAEEVPERQIFHCDDSQAQQAAQYGLQSEEENVGSYKAKREHGNIPRLASDLIQKNIIDTVQYF